MGDDPEDPRPRVLIAMRRVPAHARVGNTAVILALAQALREKGARVEALVISERAFGRRPVVRMDLPQGAFDRIHLMGGLRLGPFAAAARPGPWLGAAGALASGRARANGVWPVTLPVSAAEIASFRAELRREPCLAVIADYVFLAPLARVARSEGVRGVVYLHDLVCERYRRFCDSGLVPDVPPMTLEEEVHLVRDVDAAIAIQADEAALLSAQPGAPPVIVASMTCAPVRIGRRPEADRLVFVGSDNPANADAISWFLAEVWPLLRQARPKVSLDVVGAVGGTLAAVPQGVTRHGPVPDLGPKLARACLAVAPQRIGSGLNVKLLDYLAHGLPVVASPLARAGLAPDADACVFPAEEAAAFARLIADLLADGQRLAEARAAAFAYIEAHHSREAVYGELFRLLGLDGRG